MRAALGDPPSETELEARRLDNLLVIPEDFKEHFGLQDKRFADPWKRRRKHH